MIVFINPGLIDLDAVRTMGVSVKQPGSFGFFGTGLKFALATILRGGGKVTLWRGAERHEFGTIEREIRGEAFQIVTLDGEQMGITTQLGRTWESWMVLRELGCNARDEGGDFQMIEAELPPCFEGRDDHTTIMVEWAELDTAYRQRAQLFVEGEALFVNDKLRILPGPSTFLFYRGVRAFKLPKPSIYTYDILANQVLTEDRTLASTYMVDILVRDALLAMEDKALIRPAITAGDGYHEHKLDFDQTFGTKASRQFLDSAIEAREAREHLNDSAKKVLMRHIRDRAGEEAYSGGTYRRVIDDAFSYAIEQLDEIGIKFPEDSPFVVVEEGMPGDAKSMIEKGRIYVLRDLLDMGAREIAGELIKRWVDLNVEGYDQEAVTRLLTPILINGCLPKLLKDETLVREDQVADAAEAEPAA